MFGSREETKWKLFIQRSRFSQTNIKQMCLISLFPFNLGKKGYVSKLFDNAQHLHDHNESLYNTKKMSNVSMMHVQDKQ